MSSGMDAIRLASTARLQGKASTAVFRVLLEALARPGRPIELPELAIYEALRNPGEPGIAQAHYTWDGRALQAVGPS